MLCIIDTNVLLVSVSSRSKFHWLYKLILEKKIEIAFTNDILIEYEEQIGTHWNSEVASDITRSLLELSTARPMTTYFDLNLIVNDADDNKFADCAFASNADYIVTNDKDFDILKNIPFPSIQVVDIQTFEIIARKERLLS